jgi:hypothetical protein
MPSMESGTIPVKPIYDESTFNENRWKTTVQHAV